MEMDAKVRAAWTRRKVQAMQRIVENLQRRPGRSRRSRRSINSSSRRSITTQGENLVVANK